MPKRIEHKVLDGIEYKLCSSCKRWLDLKDFDNSSQTWDNKHGRCKKCQKQYYTTHKQERLQKQTLYHQRNRTIRCIKMRQYYQNNTQQFRDYYVNNKHNFYKHARESNRRRRAIKKEVHCDKINCIELLKIFNSTCAYCGTILDLNTMTIDHVLALADGGAHDMLNVVPSCIHCNCSKRKSNILDWYPKQEFFTEERLFKILTHCHLGDSAGLAIWYRMKGDDKVSRTSDDKDEDILRRRALARQRYGNMQLDLTDVSLPMELSNGDINMYSGLKSPSFDINIARGRV